MTIPLNTDILLLRPLYSAPEQKLIHSFQCVRFIKNLLATATPLIWSNFNGRLDDRITGFHSSSIM